MWVHMVFSHFESLWSMDLAELVCASISAGSDWVTCVSSVVNARFVNARGFPRSCRDTLALL